MTEPIEPVLNERDFVKRLNGILDQLSKSPDIVYHARMHQTTPRAFASRMFYDWAELLGKEPDIGAIVMACVDDHGIKVTAKALRQARFNLDQGIVSQG